MALADPFAVLVREHRALSALFAHHQEALVARRWAQAARLLDHYRQRLQAHMRVEERWLLPYGDHTLRWRPEVYLAEHRKLEERLTVPIGRLAALRRRAPSAAALIALLEEEKLIKHLAEHHHLREERGLFQELRERLPEERRARLSALLGARPDGGPQ